MVWKNVCVCVCDPTVPQEPDTPGHPYSPKWQEQTLNNIFSTILEAIKNGKKLARRGFFQSSSI